MTMSAPSDEAIDTDFEKRLDTCAEVGYLAVIALRTHLTGEPQRAFFELEPANQFAFRDSVRHYLETGSSELPVGATDDQRIEAQLVCAVVAWVNDAVRYGFSPSLHLGEINAQLVEALKAAQHALVTYQGLKATDTSPLVGGIAATFVLDDAAVLAQIDAALALDQTGLVDPYAAEVEALRAQNVKMLAAINWATGCGSSDFPGLEARGEFAGRKRMVEIAGLEYDITSGLYRATPK